MPGKTIRATLLVFLAGFILSGCSAAPVIGGGSPKQVVGKYFQALSEGDVVACAGLLADDVVVIQDPPGVKINGKKEMLEYIKNAAAQGNRYDFSDPLKVSGERVTAIVENRASQLSAIGVDSLRVYYEFRVKDGFITSIDIKPDTRDWEAVARLTSGGVGVRFGKSTEGFVVEGVVEGSPAEAAGIGPGDIITAIDGQSCKGMNTEDIILKVKGQAGSSVRLTVRQGGTGQEKEIEVVRVDLSRLQNK